MSSPPGPDPTLFGEQIDLAPNYPDTGCPKTVLEFMAWCDLWRAEIQRYEVLFAEIGASPPLILAKWSFNAVKDCRLHLIALGADNVPEIPIQEMFPPEYTGNGPPHTWWPQAREYLAWARAWCSRRTPTTDLQANTSDRLIFNPECHAVTLDGERYEGINPTAFLVLHEIHKGGGRPVSSTDLEAIPGLRAKKFKRELTKLPKKLQTIVHSKPGFGRWISLPPRCT